MKIVIVGAGIGGLSSYLFLHKLFSATQNNLEHVSVQIYEAYNIHRDNDKGEPSSDSLPSQEETQKSHSVAFAERSSPQGEQERAAESFTLKRVGGAIGIGKNGLAVLARLDDDGSILRRVQQRGNCISKWKMGTARGWKLVDANVTSSVQDDDASRLKAGSKKKPGIASTVMISRQACWEVLRDAVLEIDPHAVLTKRVIDIEQGQAGVKLTFSDGATDRCDLLVGADGLRSTVRRSLFKNSTDEFPPSWSEWLLRRPPQQVDYITPHYEGLTGVGGYVPGAVLSKANFEPGAMSITFGPNGFFGHGYVGPTEASGESGPYANLAGWWSTFSAENPTIYTSPAPDGKGTIFDNDTALKELLARHQTWKDPSIQAILTHLKETNATLEHIYPTYTTPPLRTWSRPAPPNSTGAITLLGDAAHTLQPSSGQGACQALEDAECLALCLKHYLSKPSATASEPPTEQNAVFSALSAYESLRKPRVAKIYTQSQKMSRNKMDMGVAMEFVMYFFIWVASKLRTWEKYNDELFEYDLPAEVEKFVKTDGRAK